MGDPSVAKEIERAITRALSKTGQGGTVIVRDEQCELHAPGTPVVAIDLGDWVGQWNLLPDDIKAERADHAAQRLANALRETEGRSAAVPQAVIRERYKRVATLVAALAVLGIVVLWLSRSGFFGQGAASAESSAAPPPTGPPPSDLAARAERAKRVCEAARQRLHQGAAMGVDIEGWVVELWLARDAEGLLADDALAKWVQRGAVAEVNAAGPSELSIHPGESNLGLSTAVLRFSEGYVMPFFTAEGRERFIALAEKIADDAGAVHAGLYGRCAHLPDARDVGAWYRGIDDTGAVLSVLVAAGAYARPPAYSASKIGEGPLLANLRRRLAAFEKERQDEILRRAGGRPRPHEGPGGRKSLSLHFPLGGPTRAIQASREIAKALALP